MVVIQPPYGASSIPCPGLCVLLQDPLVFVYPAFEEDSDEHSEKYDPEASIEESIDDNSIIWKGEVAWDIWSKATERSICGDFHPLW